MYTQAITIGGIPIPSRAPWFLGTVAVHVFVALTAIIAGAVAMLSAKRRGRHPKAGTVYFWSLLVISVTTAILSIAQFPRDNNLAALGLLSITSAIIGRTARRQLWRRWLPVHITGMGVSYVTMITAFYVDNGPHLPVWNRLPNVAYWVLPAIVGAPIIWRALRRRRPEFIFQS